MFVSVGFIVGGQREEGRKIVQVEEGNVADIFTTATWGGGNITQLKLQNCQIHSAVMGGCNYHEVETTDLIKSSRAWKLWCVYNIILCQTFTGIILFVQ